MKRGRWLIIASAGLMYAGFGVVGYPYIGKSALLTSILLCGLAAWLQGWKAGLPVLILTLLYHVWLMGPSLGTLQAWTAALDPGGIAAQLCAVAVGGTIRLNRHKSLVMTEKLTRRIRERHDELRRISQYVSVRSEAECSRLSEALCHIVAQQQTGLYYHSEALLNFLAYRDASETDAARKLVDIAQESIDQVRAIRSTLCKDNFLEKGIEKVLCDLCDFLHDRTGTCFTLTLSSRLNTIPDETALNVYRIAHEAITNALRHGKATHIELSLDVDNTSCRLEIINNGRPLSSNPEKGLGMELIQQRSEIINAKARLESMETGRTRFECIIPLHAASFHCPEMWSGSR